MLTNKIGENFKKKENLKKKNFNIFLTFINLN